MIFHIFGNAQELVALENMLAGSILDFELPSDRINIKKDTDPKTLGVALLPALVFEEPVLQFQEILIEGQMPQKEELDMLFSGLFGVACSTGCGGGCGWCGGWCGM